MLTGFAGASIWSEDLSKLLPFYRDVLGLKVSMESPNYVILGNDMNAPSLALATHSEVHGHNTDPARHMVAFATTDVQADYQRLTAAGVEFVSAPPAKTACTSPPSRTQTGTWCSCFSTSKAETG